ncbi:MAG: hypothetical protein HFE78_08535 [Clostridiales bacterium]|nr:hypothetical protein [Clostridiales bacterium]
MSNIKNLNLSNQKIKYKVCSDPEDNRYISFTPNDFDLPTRFAKAASEIKTFVEELETLKSDNIDKNIELLHTVDQKIKAQINYIFDYDVCQIVFGAVSCLTVNKENGMHFFEEFITALVPVIESEFSASIKQMKERTKKYTDLKGRFEGK